MSCLSQSHGKLEQWNGSRSVEVMGSMFGCYLTRNAMRWCASFWKLHLQREKCVSDNGCTDGMLVRMLWVCCCAGDSTPCVYQLMGYVLGSSCGRRGISFFFSRPLP